MLALDTYFPWWILVAFGGIAVIAWIFTKVVYSSQFKPKKHVVIYDGDAAAGQAEEISAKEKAVLNGEPVKKPASNKGNSSRTIVRGCCMFQEGDDVPF